MTTPTSHDRLTRDPYVGVSGLVNAWQQGLLVEAAGRTLGFSGPRRLLLGVKATHKTLILGEENRYGRAWYPVGDEIGTALVDDSLAFPEFSMRAVQAYAEPDLVAGYPRYLSEFVARLFDWAGSWITHIQFDLLAWHDSDLHTRANIADAFERITEARVGIILQAHGPAMDLLGPDGCADTLADLGVPALTHVLFDASHGTGTGLDAADLLPFLDAAFSHPGLDHVRLGVAGGLDETNLDVLAPLLDEHPDLSWDAESRLHLASGHGAARPLSMPRVRAYLESSAQVLAAPGS